MSPFLTAYLIYFIILALCVFFIYKWVTKFLSLKQEQNDILRELVLK